jgi:hypothetical protein
VPPTVELERALRTGPATVDLTAIPGQSALADWWADRPSSAGSPVPCDPTHRSLRRTVFVDVSEDSS